MVNGNELNIASLTPVAVKNPEAITPKKGKNRKSSASDTFAPSSKNPGANATRVTTNLPAPRQLRRHETQTALPACPHSVVHHMASGNLKVVIETTVHQRTSIMKQLLGQMSLGQAITRCSGELATEPNHIGWLVARSVLRELTGTESDHHLAKEDRRCADLVIDKTGQRRSSVLEALLLLEAEKFFAAMQRIIESDEGIHVPTSYLIDLSKKAATEEHFELAYAALLAAEHRQDRPFPPGNDFLMLGVWVLGRDLKLSQEIANKVTQWSPRDPNGWAMHAILAQGESGYVTHCVDTFLATAVLPDAPALLKFALRGIATRVGMIEDLSLLLRTMAVFELINCDDAEAWLILARRLHATVMQSGDITDDTIYTRALVAVYKHALKIEPRSPAALSELARLHWQREERTEAKHYFSQLLEHHSNSDNGDKLSYISLLYKDVHDAISTGSSGEILYANCMKILDLLATCDLRLIKNDFATYAEAMAMILNGESLREKAFRAKMCELYKDILSKPLSAEGDETAAPQQSNREILQRGLLRRYLRDERLTDAKPLARKIAETSDAAEDWLEFARILQAIFNHEPKLGKQVKEAYAKVLEKNPAQSMAYREAELGLAGIELMAFATAPKLKKLSPPARDTHNLLTQLHRRCLAMIPINPPEPDAHYLALRKQWSDAPYQDLQGDSAALTRAIRQAIQNNFAPPAAPANQAPLMASTPPPVIEAAPQESDEVPSLRKPDGEPAENLLHWQGETNGRRIAGELIGTDEGNHSVVLRAANGDMSVVRDEQARAQWWQYRPDPLARLAPGSVRSLSPALTQQFARVATLRVIGEHTLQEYLDSLHGLTAEQETPYQVYYRGGTVRDWLRADYQGRSFEITHDVDLLVLGAPAEAMTRARRVADKDPHVIDGGMVSSLQEMQFGTIRLSDGVDNHISLDVTCLCVANHIVNQGALRAAKDNPAARPVFGTDLAKAANYMDFTFNTNLVDPQQNVLIETVRQGIDDAQHLRARPTLGFADNDMGFFRLMRFLNRDGVTFDAQRDAETVRLNAEKFLSDTTTVAKNIARAAPHDIIQTPDDLRAWIAQMGETARRGKLKHVFNTYIRAAGVEEESIKAYYRKHRPRLDITQWPQAKPLSRSIHQQRG